MTKFNQFVTVKEAAKLLGVSPNTLRTWDRTGKIRVYRSPMSKYRLFKKSDLVKILRQIDESGKHPTGYVRTALRAKPQKPR